MRKLHSVTLGVRHAYVYWDSFIEEYVTVCLENGKRSHQWHCGDDKGLAIEKADTWVVTEQGIL